MLPCIVIDFFLNNQPDALIIQIYCVIKLYMFRVSSLPIIRRFLLYIRHWQVPCSFFMTASKQSQDSAWKRSSKTCMKIASAECTDDGQRRCPKHVELNNQQDTLIIQIYSVIKLYMFRVSFLPIIRSFLLYIRHW
jgi:hypothetical protein